MSVIAAYLRDSIFCPEARAVHHRIAVGFIHIYMYIVYISNQSRKNNNAYERRENGKMKTEPKNYECVVFIFSWLPVSCEVKREKESRKMYDGVRVCLAEPVRRFNTNIVERMEKQAPRLKRRMYRSTGTGESWLKDNDAFSTQVHMALAEKPLYSIQPQKARRNSVLPIFLLVQFSPFIRLSIRADNVLYRSVPGCADVCVRVYGK